MGGHTKTTKSDLLVWTFVVRSCSPSPLDFPRIRTYDLSLLFTPLTRSSLSSLIGRLSEWTVKVLGVTNRRSGPPGVYPVIENPVEGGPNVKNS